jgi:outer membrane protein assembly factor BamB
VPGDGGRGLVYHREMARTTRGARPRAGLQGLPVLWAVQGREEALGLHVDEREVWAGWETGDVAVYDHAGRLLRRWRLPDGVDALIADEGWRYAGCRDGKVYDLTGKTPRVAYELASGASIQWIDVYAGRLCASDARGALTVLDADCELLWSHRPRNAGGGWMARADASGVYLGNSQGVTKLSWRGRVLWTRRTPAVGFGWQESEVVYAITGIHTPRVAEVVALDKATGRVRARGPCSSHAPYWRISSNAASCAARPDGVFYGAICEALFGFDARGVALWETPTRVGAPCSMAYHDGRLYVVTHRGQLAALDVSDAAVVRAEARPAKQAAIAKLARVAVSARTLERTTRADVGVVVACTREAGKLRVRVVSPGYDPSRFCQFPRDIREAGARYVVDEVRESSRGGFYRVFGEVRRLEDEGEGTTATTRRKAAKTARGTAAKKSTAKAAGKTAKAAKVAKVAKVAKKTAAAKTAAGKTARGTAGKTARGTAAKKSTAKKTAAKVGKTARGTAKKMAAARTAKSTASAKKATASKAKTAKGAASRTRARATRGRGR